MLSRARLILVPLVAGIACAAPAEARERGFDVPPGPAADAIRVFSRQADIQVLVGGEAVKGRRTSGLRGRLPVRAALERLLAGSGLRVQSFDGSVAVLVAQPMPLVPPPIVEAAEPIVVTGSRIPQDSARTAMPLRVIDMEVGLRAGRTTAYDVLTREPAVAVGIGLGNAFGQGWDAGVSSVSLRGLGTARSLTLIDGMRRVSGSARSSAVDITMIPAAMIERMEIITGGATAIYGADAVTGAINILTKKRLEGLNLSATQGISQEGDASETSLSLSTGTTFAHRRGSLALGMTYSRIAPLDYAQRYPTYIRSIANPANTGANDGIPDQITIPDFRQIYFSYQPSFYFAGQSWIVDGGTPRPAHYDETYYPGHFSYGNGGDGRNLRDTDQLRGGLDSLAALGRLDYELTDSITYRAYADFGASNYRGTAGFPRHRDDSRTMWFNGAGGSVAYLDNPFLPPALRDFMVANGLSRLDIERTYGNFPVMREYHRRRSLTVGQQLEGPLGDSFHWQVSQQYGRTVDNVRTTDIPYVSHWLAARDVITDPQTGLPACRDPVAREQGCEPLDIFSLAPPSAALSDYVLGMRRERRVNTQSIWGLDIDGAPLQLPQGPLMAVLGLEHRRETLHTRDDPLAASEYAYGGSGYTVHPNLDAAFSVWELFAEAKAPVLRDLPLARSVDLEAAYRLSRYSSVGATGTWKLGGTWTPIRGLMLRAMRSRSVRVPNFGELYEVPISRQSGSITDPCEAADYFQSATRSANCKALGILVPLGDFKVGPVITTRGNPDLRPETSNSLTLGAVVSPATLPGFELTLDYWNIDIRDAITQFSYTTILNLCVDLPTIDNIFCDAIARSSVDGRVNSVSTSQVNAQRLTARGIDFGMRYHGRLGAGKIGIEANGTYLLQQLVESTPGVTTGNVRYAGDSEHPRIQATARVVWEIGRLIAQTDLRFLGASRYEINAESGEVFDRYAISAHAYADVSISYRLDDGLTASLGVRNLTGIDPPQIYPVYKDTTIYDQVGRYFFMTISFRH
ncbi:TonB-dependent receptor domain-containing protein [Novosphingobium sp. ZW T3_23]|uniref:TonB-dependent receptor domain-containing protein n=1 Tax=Novosphingobium sp. ZW T3_23 TaxID=3378084 RepID=UPI0038555FEF